MNDPTPDGQLLRRYRESGDEAAFAELRRRHERLVLATCRRETGNAALAEDAAQEVFLLVTRKRFADDASLAGWLHGAARLACQNLVRGESRRLRRERRAFEEFATPEAGWNAIAPHVDAALSALREDDREAVLLRFAGEMSLAEVGRTLGIEENAARMRVSRALDRMRGQLRRAGVGVSALLLASLLSTRLADAEAPLFAIPRPVARPFTLAKVAAGCVAVGAIFGVRSLFVPLRLGSMETKILFARTVGPWQGTLEFADDASGARTKTATHVEVTRRDGGIDLVATYPSYSAVDTTTIRPDGEGRFRIETRGSHNLDGQYELVQTRGIPSFVGYSPAVRGEVRLRVVASEGALSLQEDVRRGEGPYRLRNRFDLTR